MNVIATSDSSRTPSAEYRFFLYDPEGEGMRFYRTAEIRDSIAKAAIAAYCDGDGWSEEVTTVCAGEVTATPQKINVQLKPKRDDFTPDENGDEAYEEAMDEWPDSDHDYICDFELQPLSRRGSDE
jgi:hypothetical protein